MENKQHTTMRCADLPAAWPASDPLFIFILPLRAWHFFLMAAPDPLPLAFILRSRHERFFFFLQEECFVFPYCRGGATYSHASWEMLTSKLWTTVAPLFYGTLNAFVFFFSSLLFLFASFNERRSFPIWSCLLLITSIVTFGRAAAAVASDRIWSRDPRQRRITEGQRGKTKFFQTKKKRRPELSFDKRQSKAFPTRRN